MYAIVDIETTGGAFNEEGITEIAIYRYDGHEIVDQFISLVNPELPIQPFVVKLTGINNAMLRSAPKFYEVAKRIVEITQDCVLVAHNASFDYRILQMEFARLGFPFQCPTLCTVELSKKLIPDMPSYSLGKLVRSLGIPMADRHRASGDAMATLKLFKILLAKDSFKTVTSELVQHQRQKGLEPRLLDLVASVPSVTGVYYFYNEKGGLIYIGKSKNIKKRVIQHFTGTTAKARKLRQQVYAIGHEETGSELIALLKESHEIKLNKPLLNRAQRHSIFPWGIYAHTDTQGYRAFRLEKIDGRKRELMAFTSLQEAKNTLFSLTEKHQLCQKINGLYDSQGGCFQWGLHQCKGACVGQESSSDYNLRAEAMEAQYRDQHQSYVIVDRGRTVEERSAVWIENGLYKGYCFFDLNAQIHRPDILRSIVIAQPHNRDTQRIIRGYLRKHRVLRVVPLPPEMPITDAD